MPSYRSRYRGPRAPIVPTVLTRFGQPANSPTGYNGPILKQHMFNDAQGYLDAKRERILLRRQAQANGTAPASRVTGAPRAPRKTKMRGGPAFATALPTAAELQVQALAKLEDALVMTAQEKGITAATEAAFAKYTKLKAVALASVTSGNMALRNEANVAMKLALIEIVKVTF